MTLARALDHVPALERAANALGGPFGGAAGAMAAG
jgi:hypothetical protein